MDLIWYKNKLNKQEIIIDKAAVYERLRQGSDYHAIIIYF